MTRLAPRTVPVFEASPYRVGPVDHPIRSRLRTPSHLTTICRHFVSFQIAAEAPNSTMEESLRALFSKWAIGLRATGRTGESEGAGWRDSGCLWPDRVVGASTVLGYSSGFFCAWLQAYERSHSIMDLQTGGARKGKIASQGRWKQSGMQNGHSMTLRCPPVLRSRHRVHQREVTPFPGPPERQIPSVARVRWLRLRNFRESFVGTFRCMASATLAKAKNGDSTGRA